jgi:hypothetical protein
MTAAKMSGPVKDRVIWRSGDREARKIADIAGIAAIMYPWPKSLFF